MRFLDWDGNGAINAQDITTSMAIDDERDQAANPPSQQTSNSSIGCATIMALSLLTVILVIGLL